MSLAGWGALGHPALLQLFKGTATRHLLLSVQSAELELFLPRTNCIYWLLWHTRTWSFANGWQQKLRQALSCYPGMWKMSHLLQKFKLLFYLLDFSHQSATSAITASFKITTWISRGLPLWYKLKHVARNKRSLWMKFNIFWIKLKEIFCCVWRIK